MKYIKIIDYIASWINQLLTENKAKGFVYGISGGIDSALVAAIAKKFFKDNSLGLLMNIDNSYDDIKDQQLLINTLKVRNENIDLQKVYQSYLMCLPENQNSKMNLKSRIRMNTLYYYAQILNYLVCGTSNADEIYTGYFTKYGDSGSDFIPLANLLKNDIVESAKLLNVPNSIINKKPTAGLYEGQSDENELKVTYKEIDSYLLGKEISGKSKERIEFLHKISEHKRKMSKSILPLGNLLINLIN